MLLGERKEGLFTGVIGGTRVPEAPKNRGVMEKVVVKTNLFNCLSQENLCKYEVGKVLGGAAEGIRWNDYSTNVLICQMGNLDEENLALPWLSFRNRSTAKEEKNAKAHWEEERQVYNLHPGMGGAKDPR
jgi:hypothetical protein